MNDVGRFPRGLANIVLKCAAIILIAVSFTGCRFWSHENPEFRDAKDAVKAELNDPDSANFRNVRAITVRTREGSVVRSICGEVNAKNGFGGYSGFAPFVYIISHTHSHYALTQPKAEGVPITAWEPKTLRLFNPTGPHYDYHTFCDEDGAVRAEDGVDLITPELE